MKAPRLRLLSGIRWPRVDPNVWIVLAFALFAVLPLAGPDYFFQAHDSYQSVFFLTEFDAALHDGIWYPAWATDQAWGYGYPLFVFYSPLPYYVAEGFHLLGAGMVVAVKWTWALATAGAGLAMYAYARHVLGRQRGLLAAVVYVYVPYHLVDIYVRAALAEYCAFVWLPLALLAFHRLVEEVRPRQVAFAGLTYGALWMTHNVTALAFTPLLAAYVLFRLFVQRRPGGEEAEAALSGEMRGRSRIAWLATGGRAAGALGGAVLGLGIAAALLLPSLLERQFINQQQLFHGGYDYARYFVYPFQLLSPFWGYGASGPGPVDGMSFQLGAVALLLAMVGTVVCFWRPARERVLILFFAIATGLLVFLVLPVSAPVWAVLPMAGFVQFPWRVLALIALTLSILAATSVHRLPDTEIDGRILAVALVAVLGSFAYTLPQYTPAPPGADGPLLSIELETKYNDMVGLTAWAKESPPPSPMVAQYESGSPLVTAEALAPGSSVEMIRSAGASDELWVRSPSGTVLRFYTAYFPGWRVTVDGQRLPDSALRPETDYGLLTIDVPAGAHRVLLRWGDTWVRAAGKALTLASLILAAGLALAPWPPRRRVRAASVS